MTDGPDTMDPAAQQQHQQQTDIVTVDEKVEKEDLEEGELDTDDDDEEIVAPGMAAAAAEQPATSTAKSSSGNRKRERSRSSDRIVSKSKKARSRSKSPAGRRGSRRPGAGRRNGADGSRSDSSDRDVAGGARGRRGRSSSRDREHPKRTKRDRDREKRLREAREKDMVRQRADTSRQLCKFFAEGKCQKGHDCPYSHDIMQLARKKEICKFYLQGFCGKGDSCLFMHGEFPCKFYHTGVECYQGDKCRFSHQPLTDDGRHILRRYLDSGELPDDHLRNRETAISMHKPAPLVSSTILDPTVTTSIADGLTTVVSTTGPIAATSYQPVKPVAKPRASVLGDVTDEMRKSYWTWAWQMEMKDLELAYVGTKRNLFCIEPPNCIDLDEKPSTPPLEEFEEPDEPEQSGSAPAFASFYVDTLGDRDERILPPEAFAALDNPVPALNDDQHLIEASFHDEDLRLPPDACFNLAEPSAVFGQPEPASRPLPLPLGPPPLAPYGITSPGPDESSTLSLNNGNSNTATEDNRRLSQTNIALDPRLIKHEAVEHLPSGERRLLSDSDDDAADEPLQAALKRLDQQKADGPAEPTAADNPESKAKLDIAKLLNVIRMTTNPITGATANPAPAPQSNYFPHLGGQTGVISSSIEAPRDPRQRRGTLVKSESQDSKDGLADPFSTKGDPTFVPFQPGVFVDWRPPRKMPAPVIDYSDYVQAFCAEDSKLKNDPRLLKYMTREPMVL